MVSLRGHGVALGLRVPNQFLHVIWAQRVQDVEEVGPVGLAALREHVWQVEHYFPVVLDLRIDVLDAELVELGHVHCAEICQLQELLAVGEDQLQVVLVQHVLGWQIELNYT